MDDLISRKMVIDAIIRGEPYGIQMILESIEALPSVMPKRKSAYLIDPNPYGKCSNCGQLIDIRDEYNYCSSCGADMRGDHND